jgi:hypothetical protein
MTEPTIITNWRTMLLSCASVNALVSDGSFPASSLVYPTAPNAPDDSTAPLVKPYGVIWTEDVTRTPIMLPGVPGIQRGTLKARFYFDSEQHDIGTAEKFANDVEGDLQSLTSGIYLREVSTQVGAAPTGSNIAAGITEPAARTLAVEITAQSGLRA